MRRWRCVAGHWYCLETRAPDRTEGHTMKRIRIERPKVRKERLNDPLPLDPRDPDILRAKHLMYVRRGPTERGHDARGRARGADDG
jgi:hypothetical protein